MLTSFERLMPARSLIKRAKGSDCMFAAEAAGWLAWLEA